MAARVSAALAVSLAALAVTSTAFGAYNPTLLVGETSPALGGQEGVRIFVRTSESDDATGMVSIYAPRGYGVRLDHPVGTVVGSAIAFVRTGLPGAARQAVQGSLTVVDRTAHASSSCAPGLHDAVWLYDFPLGGRTYRLPLYVDRSSGADAAHSSARIRLCPESPAAPPPAIVVSYADITIRRVFTNPTARGTYAWNAVFVPYAAGAQTLNHAQAAQSTAYIGLPATFVASAKLERHGRSRFARVTACLTESGEPLRGARVTLWYGGATIFGSRPVAVARTNARGCAVIRLRLRSTMVAFATLRVPVRTRGTCTPSLAPRCSAATAYPPSAPPREIRIRR